MDPIRTLYDWTARTRAVLVEHLAAVPQERYLQPLDILTGESVYDRHRHVAGCYAVWLGRGLEGRAATLASWEDWRTAEGAPRVFAEVDALVERFVSRFEGALDRSIEIDVRDGRLTVTPRWLLVHPITHEFHHKGQIVVASRALGYPAPDTDLVLP